MTDYVDDCCKKSSDIINIDEDFRNCPRRRVSVMIGGGVVVGANRNIFFRGMVACNLVRARDGWGWDIFLGVEVNHPLNGVRCVRLDNGKVLHHIAYDSEGIETLAAKWWFQFEGSKNDELVSLLELQKASDELNIIGLNHLAELEKIKELKLAGKVKKP